MRSLKVNIEGKDAHLSYTLNGKPYIRYTTHEGQGPLVSMDQVEQGYDVVVEVLRNNTFRKEEVHQVLYDVVQRVADLERIVSSRGGTT